MFLLGKIISSILFPPGVFIVLILASAAFMWRRWRRAAIATAGLDAVLMFLLAFPPFANALLSPLENQYPAVMDSAKANAVVVLGGGFLENSPEYAGKPSLSPESMKRAVYGALLAKKLDLPLVFTGGNPGKGKGAQSEAEAASSLWIDMGIEFGRIRVEDKSRDTFENAAFTKALVSAGPILLVTSAWHMPRSMLAFKKNGIESIAAPTSYRVDRHSLDFLDLLPGSDSLLTSQLALHEYLGLLWYSLAR